MKDKFKANYLSSQASGIGFAVVFCVLGGFFLGYFLDKKFDSMPLFLISGVLLGIFSAGYCVFKLMFRLKKYLEDENNDKNN